MGLVSLPQYGSDPATVTAQNLDAKVNPLATEFNGNIENANIKASAGITDSKLATISTAGKVSGAAITSLASIPSGAGVIPTANLPADIASNTTSFVLMGA